MINIVLFLIPFTIILCNKPTLHVVSTVTNAHFVCIICMRFGAVFNFYCRIFVMMTCLHCIRSYVFGQNVIQLNVYGLYLKLMLTFRCTFILSVL